MAEKFDYIVVGAGSAGCVVTRRLLDAGHSVCLVESGARDTGPFVRMPVGFIKTLRNPKLTWRYRTEPCSEILGRKLPMPHGRILGGTSAVNGMVFVRGQPEDFDEWEGAGNPGWGFKDVLPYFMRSERRLGPSDPDFRGSAGPQPVSDSDWHDPLCEAFIDAAGTLGLPRNPDINAATQYGANYYQRAIENQRRVSSARAWLGPVYSHPRLKLILEAHVSRVLIADGRAIGVLYTKGERGGPTRRVEAGEVIISAGALSSPKILQLSGIGPGGLLKELEIPLTHELPGVGKNLRDHYSTRIIARATPKTITLNQRVIGARFVTEVMRWLIGRPSILGITAAVCHAFGKSDGGLSRPDIAVMFTPASYKGGVLGVLDDFPGMTFGAWQMRPLSSGYVHARSNDAFDLPLIQPNYLAHQTDQVITVAALRFARRILRASPIADLCAAELAPGPGVESDDELLDFARQTGTTSCHLVGSCKMGPSSDPFAVVDANLRVHGIKGLRVIDASIMPTITSGNTNAPTLMIAEKGADSIICRTAACG